MAVDMTDDQTSPSEYNGWVRIELGLTLKIVYCTSKEQQIINRMSSTQVLRGKMHK